VSGQSALPENRSLKAGAPRAASRKINARFAEISFPKGRRKTLSITLRKCSKKGEIERSSSEMHRLLCDWTSHTPSAIYVYAQTIVQSRRGREIGGDPFSTRATDSEKET
jgi:hypothetical protein